MNKEITIDTLAAIKNGEVFRVKTLEGVILEGNLFDLVNFADKHNLYKPVSNNHEKDIERKAAAEVYNTTEGTEKFEVHHKNGTGCYDTKAHERRELQRDVARAELAALKGFVTRVNRKPSVVKVMDVKYIPEQTFIPSEAKRTKTSRLLVEVKTVTGEKHLINIADFFHRKVGRCSANRTAALIKNAPHLVLEKGKLTEDSLFMWFVLSGFLQAC